VLPDNIFHPIHSCVYPGDYEPPLWTEKELIGECRKLHGRCLEPPIIIKELSDHYRIEVAAPGFSRGDFFVHAGEGMLSILAFREGGGEQREHLSFFPFRHFGCIEKQVALPVNLDTDFSTAEYKNGFLIICFFKTNDPGKSEHMPIIVY
jgi:HSP20 family protein